MKVFSLCKIQADAPLIAFSLGIVHRQCRVKIEDIVGHHIPEQGSLLNVYRTCKKENCPCTRGQKHGPFLYLNQKIDGKWKQFYVGKVSDQPRVKRVRIYMQFQDTLAQVRKITKQVDSLFNSYRNQLTRKN